MSDEVTETVEECSGDEPLVHQLAKAGLAIVVSFFVRKSYDEQLINFRKRH